MTKQSTTRKPARLIFSEDYQTTQEGPLAPGQSVGIEFHGGRIPREPPRSNGLTCSSISCYARFHGNGDIHQFPLRADAGATAARPAPETEPDTVLKGSIAIPSGAEIFSIWFVRSGDFGWVRYDSDYGRNYNFAFGPVKKPKKTPAP